MIIQCDACQTRFKLPDEKLKPEGVKVRCTKCETIFHVPGPAPAPVQPPPAEAVAAEKPAASDFDFSDSDQAPDAGQKTGSLDEFDFDEFNMEDVDAGDNEAPLSPPRDSEKSIPRPQVKEVGKELPDFNLPEDFSFDEEPDQSEPLADFSPEDLSLETGEENTVQEPASAETTNEFSVNDLSEPPSDDFSFSDEEEHTIGGDLGQTFDVGDDLGELPELGERPAPKVEEFGSGTDDEFSFTAEEPATETGEISGSRPAPAEFAFEAPPPREDAPSQTGEPAAEDFIFEREPIEAPSPREEEKSAPVPPPAPMPAPPPPAKSRKRSRKGSSRVKKRRKNRHTGLLLMLLLTAMLGGGYAYFAQLKGTWDPHILLRHLQQLTGTKAPEDPTVHIQLLNMRSSFVSNQNAGQLFVISGEVRNNYNHTRSAISVKGMIYDAKGQAVMQQTAFCGNPLDEAALRTLPYAKIEENMNNQFGDSLSNLDVAPGKTVPFTIVFKKLPEQVTEFNVEVADSRPGTR